ncbi:hypothetical protein RKE25_02840 [Dyella sp. BiH032]|uniref:hypothetical protein n=1 Tax=Dyella sp. BiH032 TaxID=3075430 RepID=UPI0028932DDA|nr:hypothetical protein [Dyella sp. BiH032]WNL46592.1 hypothetical protein RKE25_02840 [Dyella sp. BiH032]
MQLELQAYRSQATLPTDRAAAAAQATDALAHPDAHVSQPQLAFHPQLASLTRAMFGHATFDNRAGAASSFDAQVRGTDAKAIDLQLARMAQDVYDPNSKGIEGWTRLTDDQLMQAGIDPASLEDPSTGFRAAIYQDANGDRVLAFAGSNDAKDWLNNAEQGLGISAAQYNQAVALATEARAAFGDSLAITGHSLGGGLASIASLATDSASVTFNAAGLNDATLRRLVPEGDPGALRQQAENGLIRRYAVNGEILTTTQEHTPLPDAVGHKIALNDPDPVAKPDLHWYDWLTGKAEVLQAKYAADVAKHSVDLHMDDAVLAAMQKDHPWAA